MLRFDHDEGMFWLPAFYGRPEKIKRDDKAPRMLPPIPDTGWHAREYFPDLSRAKVIGLDIETCDPNLRDKGPGVRRGDAFIAGVSVATEDWSGYYPIAHSMGQNLDRAKVYAWLKDQLARDEQPKVGANLLYDLDFLAADGIEVKGPLLDVQYADPLLDEYCRSYSLDAIAKRRLGESKETSLVYQWCADAYGGAANGAQRSNLWRTPSELVGPYAEQDARLPVRIIRKQWDLLRDKGLLHIFRMECGLIRLLLRMRQQGVRLDMPRVMLLDAELDAAAITMQADLGINVHASEEIARLCEQHRIDFPRTEKGAPSFVKKWLLDHPHPLMHKVSELRTLYKMRDTFVRGAFLSNHIRGCLHCELNPLRSDDYGTVSGRFSCSHPNLQQVPKRDDVWGPRMRSCFIAHDDEHAFGSIDLSQIEFRLAAHYGIGSNAEEVRERYRLDPKMDFYQIVVELTGLDRSPSKNISLGTLYGMREKKFAMMTGRSLREAKELFAQFNDRLPFMRETYDATCDEALDVGYIRTIGGRLCTLDEHSAHKALNRRLQGSCADMLKRSMLSAFDAGIFDVLRLYLSVHDELDFGIPKTKAGIEAARELHAMMVSAYPLSVPVRANMGIGRNWGDIEDCEPGDLSLDKLGKL
jgi:DNA polymerase I-like protein with 3'-5' exonuclease and polymerase domains